MSSNTEEQIDDIFEDLMIGHNFEYASKEVKKIVSTLKAEYEEKVRQARVEGGEFIANKYFNSPKEDAYGEIGEGLMYLKRLQSELNTPKNGEQDAN